MAEPDYAKVILSIAQDIVALKGEYPELKDFSPAKHVRGLVIDYAYRTHKAKHPGGWTAGVPNPDEIGLWFYIDFHDPDSTAQIHTQPETGPDECFGEKRVSFLLLRGKMTRPVGSAIRSILHKHGVRRCGEDSQAPADLIRAVGDTDPQVRWGAVNALHKRLPVGQEKTLWAAWGASRDPYVRQQIPMILGRMGAREFLEPMKAQIANAPQEVKDGLIAGAAKMGDAEARSAFGDLLRDARGKRTAELMEFVKYLDEPWLIHLLAPALKRRDMAVDLGTHRTAVKRRDCDLAADEVMRLSGARFSFPLNSLSQYTDAQINEVLRYAQDPAR